MCVLELICEKTLTNDKIVVGEESFELRYLTGDKWQSDEGVVRDVESLQSL